jgi:putative flavoprotein involved in K+ transport
MADLNVVVVGAGPAGIGAAVALQEMGVTDVAILERDEVGATFLQWPAETRFLTPSFPGQGFGSTDLNAVAPSTSPAFTLGREHPSGAEYARYLRGVAGHWELPVRTGVAVDGLVALPGGGFVVRTGEEVVRGRHVIWAAGEFGYPDDEPFPGASCCVHSSRIRSWQETAGSDPLVIGGYESGIDAAVHLCRTGRHVRVLDGSEPWTFRHGDPSVSLSPFTRERLEVVQGLYPGGISLLPVHVERVTEEEGGYLVHCQGGRVERTTSPPILATGFMSSLGLVAEHFEWDEDGWAKVTEQDESTVAPGLFLCGPSLRHGMANFCFIYKFRQRLGVVAAAIAQRLGADPTAGLERYRSQGMLVEDLSCCGADCVC